MIEFAELIQELKVKNLSEKDEEEYQKWFLDKTRSWYEAIPAKILEKYKVAELLEIVERGHLKLKKKTRHGDFTPWHLFSVEGGRLGLIDGEHAMKNGVEYYDIGYVIERVFRVLQNKALAEKVLGRLKSKSFNLDKLRTVMAARAIGGFLDEYLTGKPRYRRSNEFKGWVMNLE